VRKKISWGNRETDREGVCARYLIGDIHTAEILTKVEGGG